MAGADGRLPEEIVDHADVRRVYLGEEFRMQPCQAVVSVVTCYQGD